MERNIASILALAGTAAISVTLAAMAPGDAYADEIAIDGAAFASGRASAPIQDLKRLYMACDRAAAEERLPPGEAMLCSIVYEALRHRAFDGDFEKLLAWSRADTSQRLGER